MSEALTWMSAWDIRDLVLKQQVSCREVTEHFLARIEEFDPTLQAFSELDAVGARAQADRLDQDARRGVDLGPLHGIPVSIKPHIRVEGLKYSTGHEAEEPPSPFDDIVVERLRNAGAVIVGTNSMSGSGGSKDMVPGQPWVFKGWNWDFEARNPWDTNRYPGGSTAGGAAAVVSRLVPLAMGSDGGGSTRLPAAYSGAVGMHLTRGLVPFVDYVHPRLLFDTSFGPLARDVRDVALATSVLSGPDGRDYVCIQDATQNCLAELDAGVEGMRMAWTDDFGFTKRYGTPDGDRIIEHVRNAARRMVELGAVVEQTDEIWEDRAADGIGSWIAEPQSYETGISFNPDAPPPPDGYQKQAEARARNWDRFRRLFGTYDVILSVTAQRTAPTLDEWDRFYTTEGSSFPGGSFAPTYCSHTMLFNWLGFPAISVPCGFVDGLPVGLQIGSWAGREDKVFRVAQAFQRAFPEDRRPPVS